MKHTLETTAPQHPSTFTSIVRQFMTKLLGGEYKDEVGEITFKRLETDDTRDDIYQKIYHLKINEQNMQVTTIGNAEMQPKVYFSITLPDALDKLFFNLAHS